jgi:hypothetical protein
MFAVPLINRHVKLYERVGRSVDSRRTAVSSIISIAERLPVSRRLQRYHVDPIDYTTLCACQRELQHQWVPAKVERTILADPNTLALVRRFVQ